MARAKTIIAISRLTTVLPDTTRAREGLRFYAGIATRLFRNISKNLGARLLDSRQRRLGATDNR